MTTVAIVLTAWLVLDVLIVIVLAAPHRRWRRRVARTIARAERHANRYGAPALRP